MVELAPEEKVLMVVHRHWFVMLSYVLTLLFMAGAPILIYTFLVSGTFSIFPPELREILVSHIRWGAYAYSLWIAFLWIFLFIEWTNFYLDIWIITNQRVVSIDQKGFFNREITTLRYRQIQDVTVEVKGFIGSLLKFGLIEIETAGETRKILMRRAETPELAKEIIVNEQRKTHPLRSGEPI